MEFESKYSKYNDIAVVVYARTMKIGCFILTCETSSTIIVIIRFAPLFNKL